MIYLIFGLEKSHIDDKIRNIIKDLNIDKDSISKYSLISNSLNEIIEDASMMNLFQEKKVIIVEDASIFTGTSDIEIDNKLLESYINSPNPNTYLIFSCVTEKLDSRKKIVKLMNEKTKVIEISKNNINNLIDYAKDYLKEFDISNSAINYIISKTGSNKLILTTELEKLSLYKLDDKKITNEDIDKLVNTNIEDNIFSLIDCIVNNSKKKAIELYHDLLNKGEEPVKIIALLGTQYRLFYQVKKLYEQGKNETGIASILKVHPYRVKLAIGISYNYHDEKLLDNLLALANLDKDIKTGTIDGKFGLELLLLKL